MVYPDFYKTEAVGTLYAPDVTAAAAAGRALSLRPASADETRTALLLIDMQVDFIHEDGALSVPGAIADTRRTVEWIYANVGQITTIFASLDSHLPLQIFSPSWWINAAEQAPHPYTVITAQQVKDGIWRPLYEENWSREYVIRLEEESKKQLMIWPYHTLIGTPGHNLTPALYEAIAYHSAARQAQPVFINKGSIPRTEHYSIFEPEVKVDTLPHGGLDVALLDEIATYDRVYIAGQAKSHCVLESVSSLMRYYENQPGTIARLNVLIDAMSSVAHPEINFEALAQSTLDRFAEHGLKRTTTTETVTS